MTLGVLPFEDLKKKVHLTTGFFETSQYTEDAQMYVTSGNHDNAGLSIGNLQYNFGPADRAQEWFKYMIDNHVTVVNAAFGANTTELATFKNVINTYTRADRITWGDSISALVNGEKRALIPPYKDAFGTMLISAEGKAKYYSMKDLYYWTPSYELFRHLSCKSRAALASLFDTYVNKGRYYPVNALVADFDAIDADTTIDAAEKERQKIYQINWRGNYTNAVKPTPNSWDGSIDQNIFWHGDGVDDGRRGCMANQTGVYYGAVYDPETQFDINQEPATDEKVGAGPLNVNLGSIAVDNIFLGDAQISKLYLGADLIGGGQVSAVTSTRVPTTQFRTNAGSYAGIPDQTAVSLNAGQPLWIDVQEPFVGCRTYYTTDGTEPTAASNLYNNPLTFNASTTLKVKTISVFGVAAATKTLAVTVAAASVTSISPTATTQNTIPITVTLTNDQGNTIYYRVGTGAQQTYTGPFSVNQSDAGVLGTNITVTYWSTGEAEKSITYNTAGAVAGGTTVTTFASSWYVSVDWTAATNATSYNVYRSTVEGTLGDLVSEFNTTLHYDDNWAMNGTVYWYTVRPANYGGVGPYSEAVIATPPENAPVAPTGWRYLKIEGYGSVEEPVTTRMIEFEAWEGATNRMGAATILSNEAVSTGGTVAAIKDTIKTASGYPIWWTATPNARVVIDLGAERPLTKLNYYSYSTASVQRANRFRVLASNTNNGADWVSIWDMSVNTTAQPILPSGYEKIL